MTNCLEMMKRKTRKTKRTKRSQWSALKLAVYLKGVKQEAWGETKK